ncbi:hypothetical protein [Telluribacter sp.]|uniref:hypothetical protein n=1 Tax=Telluribacter sp. TaxID=1978767 RepID=UPI002E1597D6|nr:hypothetical protein [Telluribacter sp.]
MFKKLFFLLATIYFIGKTTGVVDTFFVGEETVIECSGECENEKEEVKEGSYFDKHFFNYDILLQKNYTSAPIPIAYYFNSKLITSLHANQFSPPPEQV